MVWNVLSTLCEALILQIGERCPENKKIGQQLIDKPTPVYSLGSTINFPGSQIVLNNCI